MARVTATEVKTATGITLSDAIVGAQIDIANRMIAQYDIDDAPCHTEASLKDLETYLAAHIAALVERQTTQEKIGDASESYGGKFGLRLDFTQYGQMAKMLDCSGILESLGKKRVSLAFFGGADN